MGQMRAPCLRGTQEDTGVGSERGDAGMEGGWGNFRCHWREKSQVDGSQINSSPLNDFHVKIRNNCKSQDEAEEASGKP